MRKRKIKFALELKGGEQARSIEELREYFDLEKIIGYYHDGKLTEWLEDRFYAEETEKIRALDNKSKDFNQKLCEILGAKYEEVGDPEDIMWRKERLERLKQYTADLEILAKVDFVAFDQEDLEDIVREEDTNVIYLCDNSFRFPSGILRKKNTRYIGVGKKVTAKIESGEFVDLPALNISFENVEIEGDEIKNKTNISENNSYLQFTEVEYEEFMFKLFDNVFTKTNRGFKYDNSIKFLSYDNECFCALHYGESVISFSKNYFFVGSFRLVTYSKRINYSEIESIESNPSRLFIYMKNRDKSFTIDWKKATIRVGIAIKVMAGFKLTADEIEILKSSPASNTVVARRILG